MDHFEAKTQELQTALQKGIDSLRSEYQDELTRCRADLQARTDEVDKLKVERDTALVDCAEKEKQFEQRENDLKKALRKKKKAQNRLSIDLKGRSDEVVKLQAERDTALANYDEMKKKSDERSAMSTESRAKSAVDDLIEEMAKLREENALLKKKNAEIVDECSQLQKFSQSSLDESIAQMSQLQDENTQLKEENIEIKKTSDKREQDLNYSVKVSRKTQFALRDSASEVKKLRSENDQLKEENNKLTGQLLAKEYVKGKRRIGDGDELVPRKRFKNSGTSDIEITAWCDENGDFIDYIKLEYLSYQYVNMDGWRLLCIYSSRHGNIEMPPYVFTRKAELRCNSIIRVYSGQSDVGSAPPSVFRMRKGNEWPRTKRLFKVILFNDKDEEMATLTVVDEDSRLKDVADVVRSLIDKVAPAK